MSRQDYYKQLRSLKEAQAAYDEELPEEPEEESEVNTEPDAPYPEERD